MRLRFNLQARTCSVEARPGERKRFAASNKGESAFWHWVKVQLRARGYDVIKKAMTKDGHMVDEHVYYVRTRKYMTAARKSGGKEFCVYDSMSSTYLVTDSLRERGVVHLTVER